MIKPYDVVLKSVVDAVVPALISKANFILNAQISLQSVVFCIDLVTIEPCSGNNLGLHFIPF